MRVFLCCWWERQERKCLTHAHQTCQQGGLSITPLSTSVPVELVAAIIDEESGWNPYAVSNKGAAGIMQLMPATAVRFGVRNRFLVQENIRGGVAYLAWLKQKFNGDLRLITAAYYVGEYAISSRGLEYSSPDVQGYVKRVAQRYRVRQGIEGPARVGATEEKVEVTG